MVGKRQQSLECLVMECQSLLVCHWKNKSKANTELSACPRATGDAEPLLGLEKVKERKLLLYTT